MLKCLTLNHIHLESEEACRELAEAELQHLELDHCKLDDSGASLVENPSGKDDAERTWCNNE
jgi:hypothetical protein